ncbi:MAG TPA: glycine zipper 2TM domain-containing protein [Longimicrobiales bacterium]|nr:glycine zipper 2TM domain-containing protein [Longimicrobiales bacterium]
MERRMRILALVLAVPLAFATAACGGDDDLDRSALEQDELDRELDLALQGDSLSTTFEDTADAETDTTAPTAPRQPAATTPRQTQPSPQQPPRQATPRPSTPQPRTVTRSVPTGTTFAIRMNEQLSTETSKPGDAFTATLTDPIVDAQGNVIVPAGATVRGRVTAVAASERVGQTAALKLAFEAVSFGGESYPLQATVQRADVQQASRTSRTETAGKIAAGAAAGAILGQVLGKDTESTLKGAAIGAAAGTAIAMGTSDVDAVLPVGAEVVIRLDQPITITRTVSG